MERRRTEAQLRALRLMLISLLQRSGAAVTVVAATLHVSISATTQLVNLASAAVEIVSGAVALYGRIAATKKIG